MTESREDRSEPIDARHHIERIGESLREATRSFAGLILFFISAAYVLGIVIVNIDLGRYGLTALDLARPEYVMAGTLWCLLFAPPVVLISLYPYLRALARVLTRAEETALVVGAGVTAIGIPQIVLAVALPGYVSMPYSTQLLYSLSILLVVLPLGLIGLYGTRTILRMPREPIPVVRLGFLVFAIMVATMTLPGYATHLFPRLRREFGGGRKPIVQVHLKNPPDFPADVVAVVDEKRLGPAALLLDTGSTLVIASWDRAAQKVNGPALAIDKNAVSAITYEKP